VSTSAHPRYRFAPSLDACAPFELAIYADALAGEATSLAARAERARSELSEKATARLEELSLLGSIDERATKGELRELEAALDALEELQAWVEAELAEASAA
jgi:hypothetical protein